MALPICRTIHHSHHAPDWVTLSYDERFLRRKVLKSDAGARFLVDLDQTTSLNDGDVFELDGRLRWSASARRRKSSWR